MSSGFNLGQSGNATEVGAGVVKLATQAQIDAKQADDGGVPLVVTPDKIPTGQSEEILQSFQEMDGTTTPQAVAVSNNVIYKPTDFFVGDLFLGFTKESNAPVTDRLPQYLNAAADGATVNFNIPAGTDRAITVIVTATGGTVTGVDVGGTPMTLLATRTAGSYYIYAYGLAYGTDVSPSVQTIGVSGSYTNKYTAVIAHEYVDQTTPFGESTTGVADVTPTTLGNLQAKNDYGWGLQIFGGYDFRTTTYDLPAGATLRADNAGGRPIIYDGVCSSKDTWGVTTSIAGSNVWALVTVNPSRTPVGDLTVITSGVIDGFTGLTVGAKYYVDAGDTISTSGTGAYVGIAVSTTEIELFDKTAFSGARVYQTVAETIGTGDNNPMNFQVISFDTDGYADLVGANDRLTAPMSGYYMVGGSLQGNSTGAISSRIAINGVSVGGSVSTNVGSAISSSSCLVYMEQGDYLQIIGDAGSSGYASVAGQATCLWMQRVG